MADSRSRRSQRFCSRHVVLLALVVGARRGRPDEDHLAAASPDLRRRTARTSAQIRAINSSLARRAPAIRPHADRVVAQPLVGLDLAPQHVLAVRRRPRRVSTAAGRARRSCRDWGRRAGRPARSASTGCRGTRNGATEPGRAGGWRASRDLRPASSRARLRTPGCPGPSRKNCSGVMSMSDQAVEARVHGDVLEERAGRSCPAARAAPAAGPSCSCQTSRFVSNRMREPPMITTPS